MKNVFVTILFLIVAIGFGQNTNSPKEDTKTDYNQIFLSVQIPAEPPGGMNAFRQYIASNFKMPAVYQTTIGTVIARFVVWDDGSIRNIQIVKETPENLGLGNEAIRLLISSDKWKPGVYNKRNVKQYFILPISIQITAEEKKENPIEKAK
jgi:protein TonB